MAIHPRKQELLERLGFAFHRRREAGRRPARRAHVGGRAGLHLRQVLAGFGQQVADHRANQCTDEFADEAARFQLSVALADRLHGRARQGRFRQIVDGE